MSGAHTSGPWRMTLDDFGDYTIQPQGEELAIAAVVNGQFKNLVGESHEQKANAHLIAAAPDMFDALLTALPYIESAEEDEAYKPGVVAKVTAQIRDALAKAGLGQHADATPTTGEPT